MDQKSTDQFSMDQPPSYSTPRMNEKRKTWLWSIVVSVLLAVIVVGATLIGVYMTQKHTEAVVEMAFQSHNGRNIHQTVMVNNMENVAAFYVRIDNASSTVLYDYRHDMIGFRHLSSQKCYVMRMGNSNAPTMSDVLQTIPLFQTQSLTGDSDSDITYSLLEGERADRTKLGVSINILCSDVPIYWATQDDSSQQRGKLKKLFKKIKKWAPIVDVVATVLL